MDRENALTLADGEETLRKFGYLPESVPLHSRRKVVFGCEFCLKRVETTFKSLSRNSGVIACKQCSSIAAAYVASGTTESKRSFLEARRKPLHPSVDVVRTLADHGHDPSHFGSGSVLPVAAKCDFCLNLYNTSLAVLNRRPGSACKACDAVAATYSRLKSSSDKHEFLLARRPVLDLICVDVEATIAEFGHDPRSTSSFSAKQVVALCKYCRTRVVLPMSKYSGRKARITCWPCMRKKTVETLKERYGVECTLDIPSVRLKLANPSTERIVESVLISRYGIDFVRHHVIGPYEFDFWIPSINLLVECQGDFYHGFKEHGYSGLPKDRAKSSYVENNTSHKLVWIYEHEIHLGRVNKILDFHIHGAREPHLTFDLGSLSFTTIPNSEAHAFLSQFHYLGNLGGVATCLGAFHEGLLVAVCVFGGVTRNQSLKKINVATGNSFGPSDVRELRRFCIRPNTDVKNMASFCLSKFTNQFFDTSGTKAILSFSDTTVEDVGTIYRATNWKELKSTLKSYHYLDPSTNKQIHKKTVWDLARSSHMSESDFASGVGLAMVDEMSKRVWLKLV